MHRSSAGEAVAVIATERIARLAAEVSSASAPRSGYRGAPGEGRQPDTLVRLVDDDTLAFEDTQRLAHRHSTDAELLSQFRFDDPIAGEEPAPRGRGHGGVDHHVDERARAKRLPHLVRWRRGRLLCAGREGSYGRLVRMRITPLDRLEDRIRSYKKQEEKSEDGVELATESRIRCEIDFDRDGRQSSYLRAPLSRNTSGWGTVEIPIIVVKNGEGPTVLFTGGIHGDEYEGPIAVSRLARVLDPATDSGSRHHDAGRQRSCGSQRHPALARGQSRPESLLSGRPARNVFGDAGSFLDSVILPHVDVSVDLHTAGHSMDAALSTNMHYLPDAETRAKTMAAASAFGAPYNVVFWGVDEGATLTSCVERRGILSLGTELGGWGRVNIEGVRIGERGLLNVLRHSGLIEGTPETRQRDGSPGRDT